MVIGDKEGERRDAEDEMRMLGEDTRKGKEGEEEAELKREVRNGMR